jgi:hypothetical protein
MRTTKQFELGVRGKPFLSFIPPIILVGHGVKGLGDKNKHNKHNNPVQQPIREYTIYSLTPQPCFNRSSVTAKPGSKKETESIIGGGERREREKNPIPDRSSEIEFITQQTQPWPFDPRVPD